MYHFSPIRTISYYITIMCVLMRITWTDLGAFRCFWFYQNLTGLRELNIWCYTFMRRHMVLITKMSKLYRLINQYMLFTQYSLKIKFIISCKEQYDILYCTSCEIDFLYILASLDSTESAKLFYWVYRGENFGWVVGWVVGWSGAI